MKHSGNMSRRVVLVTGGTNGIGRAVALRLAQGGDRVLFAGRDEARGAAVLDALSAARPDASHAFLRADVSLLAETARLATQVEAHTDRLDAIVMCAGVLSTIPEWTSEGLERNFVLSYLGRFLLVRRLLPLLQRADSGRIVLVAAAGQYRDTLDFDDLQYRRGKPGLSVACRTQFANDLFARELAARLSDTRIEVTCVHPGLAATDVFRNARGLPWYGRALAPVVQRLFAASPDAAAETPAWLAQSPEATGISGAFYGPRRKPRTVPPRADRTDRRAALWAASEALVRAHLEAETPTPRWYHARAV